jgi:ribosomal protein L44E
MKKIPNHISTYCSFCKRDGVEKVKAIWRLSYNSIDRACDAHKQNLAEIEDLQRKMDSHYTEGDYQSWMRL